MCWGPWYEGLCPALVLLVAGRSPDVTAQLPVIHCHTRALFTLWPCLRAQACSTVGTGPRGRLLTVEPRPALRGLLLLRHIPEALGCEPAAGRSWAV